MLDTGALLHAHGITHIETATQAAEALRPVGGEFAFLLFAVGIIGTGLLAVPVLAGSGGYALAEIARWPRGLAKKLASARAFYGTIAAVTTARTGAESNPHQSHQGAFLERGDQWPVRRTDRGPGHADDD